MKLNINDAQLKFMLDITHALWRREDSRLFHEPVDTVKFNIPQYRDMIKHPMDMGTIKMQLNKRVYQSAEECMADYKLMFDNCLTFNSHPANPYHQTALSVREAYNKLMQKFPQNSEHVTIENQTTGNASSQTSSYNQLPARRRKQSVDMFENSPAQKLSRKKQNTGTIRKSVLPQVYSQFQTSEKPIHVPLPTITAQSNSSVNSSQLKYCCHILKEMSSDRHMNFSEPFMVPIQRCIEVFNLLDSDEKFKQCLDLMQVKDKLLSDKYQNGAEFAIDVRSIFSNWFRFCDPNSAVLPMARHMRDLFELMYSLMPDEGVVVAMEHPSDSETDESRDESLAVESSQIIKICQQGEKLAQDCQNMVQEIDNAKLNKIAKQKKKKELKKNHQTEQNKPGEQSQAVLWNQVPAQQMHVIPHQQVQQHVKKQIKCKSAVPPVTVEPTKSLKPRGRPRGPRGPYKKKKATKQNKTSQPKLPQSVPSWDDTYDSDDDELDDAEKKQLSRDISTLNNEQGNYMLNQLQRLCMETSIIPKTSKEDIRVQFSTLPHRVHLSLRKWVSQCQSKNRKVNAPTKRKAAKPTTSHSTRPTTNKKKQATLQKDTGMKQQSDSSSSSYSNSDSSSSSSSSSDSDSD